MKFILIVLCCVVFVSFDNVCSVTRVKRQGFQIPFFSMQPQGGNNNRPGFTFNFGPRPQGRPHGNQNRPQGNPFRPHGNQGRPHGNQGRPLGNQGRPHGNPFIPHGNQGRPNGNQGRPHGNHGRPLGNQGNPQSPQNTGRPTNPTQSGQPQNIGGFVNNLFGNLLGGQNPPINFATGQGSVDPCSQNNGGCEHNCLILDEDKRRRRCQCDEGFVLNDDFKTCSDIDECSLTLTKPCQDQCTNTIGSYKCSCGGQAILLPDQRSCGGGGSAPAEPHVPVPVPAPAEPHVPVPVPAPATPLNPAPIPTSCSVDNGGCQHRCVERRGRIICRCDKGYEMLDDGVSCVDIDECTTGLSSCPGSCVNEEGSYSCGSGAQESCEIGNGGCSHRCKTARQGGIKCTCRRNFQLQSDGKTCAPQGQGTAKCDERNKGCASCRINRRGNLRCRCEDNYVLRQDRITCDPISLPVTDPCQEARCDQECRVVESRAECHCNPGFHIQNGKCFEDIVITPPVDPPPVAPPPVHPPPVAPPPVVPPPVVPPPPVKPPPVPPPPIPEPKPSIPHLPVVGENDNCGRNPYFSLDQRIVGGERAHSDDWQWMALILLKEGKQDRSFCGGALIGPYIVVSAAHCFSTFAASELIVRVAKYDRARVVGGDVQQHEVAEIRMHEGYDPISNIHDIAILKLKTPVTPEEGVQAICLPKQTSVYEGMPGIVIGFGTIYFGGPQSDFLQYVLVPVLTRQYCEESYPDKIKENMICAGYKEGGKDACQGDSGGPYQGQDPYTKQYFLAGVVSWGIECASANKPGVYTDIAKYVRWIRQHSN